MSNLPPVRPLTRRSRDSGELYRRRPEVESQIAAALALGQTELIKRASERDETAEGFLKEESLVHLIREFTRKGNFQISDDLSHALALRCLDFVKRIVRRVVLPEYFEECRNDILAETFNLILDVTSSRGDYLEVSFWHYLKRLSDDTVKKYSTLRRREENTDSYDQTVETADGTAANPLEPSVDSRDELFDRLRIREGLLSMPPHLQQAFIMHYFDGYLIESENPREMTLAKYFKKTPRTIRNWLAQGAKIAQSAQRGEL